MNCPTLLTLPLELSISWRVSTKLVVLIESLLVTLSTMPDMLYHVNMIHHTLKYASSKSQGSCCLLKIPTNPLMK